MIFSPWTPRLRNWPLLLLAAYCTIILVLPLRRFGNNDDTGTGTAAAGSDSSSKHDAAGEAKLTANSLYRRGMDHIVHREWDFGQACGRFPDTRDVLFVMKTGASEAFDKLPTQLLSSVQCLADVLIFSDKEQQVGKYHLYDALDRVSDTIKKTSPEFALYESQLQCPVSLRDCTVGRDGAWDLDKYKFLNILVRTWEKRPGRRWYLFAEADSYIFWGNMMAWLRTHVPDTTYPELYAGSVALQDDFPFAHGGSGYVVSGRLLRRVVESMPGLAARFDALAPTKCCGDLLLGMAMHEAGATVRHAFPMFNGEKTASLPFGETHWCQPILTLHHMDPEDVGTMWQYEQTRVAAGIIQLKHLYRALVEPHLTPRRDDWDNLSDDACLADPALVVAPDDVLRPVMRPHDAKSPLERRAHASPTACAAACHASGLAISQADVDALVAANAKLHPDVDGDSATTASAALDAAIDDLVARRYDARIVGHDARDFKAARRCLQWRFRPGVCCLSESVRMGHAVAPNAPEPLRWTSGWFVRGAADWTAAHDSCAPAWVHPEEIRPP